MKIAIFSVDDTDAVVTLWNRTAENRWLFHPLTAHKFHSVLLSRDDFDPAGFLLARDERGVAAGIAVGVPRGKPGERTISLMAVFDRSGNPGAATQFALEAALEYAKGKAEQLATTVFTSPRSDDLRFLDFYWRNRFVHGASPDGVIDETVSDQAIFFGRELEAFTVPDEVAGLERELAVKGYCFSFGPHSEDVANALSESDMPFAGCFRQCVLGPSPIEHLLLAFHGEAPVGGALISLPGAPHEWPGYGCDCGVFGPIGVDKKHRGGIGKVLLFRSVERLRGLSCRYALIPAAASIYPFYNKAGFVVSDVFLSMRRRLTNLTLKRK